MQLPGKDSRIFLDVVEWTAGNSLPAPEGPAGTQINPAHET